MKRPFHRTIEKNVQTLILFTMELIYTCITHNFKNHSTVDNRYVCHVLVAALEYNEYCNLWSQTAPISTSIIIQ